MVRKTSKTKTRLKIVGATLTAVFSLFSVFTATMAWFAASNTVTANGMQIMVKSEGGCTLDSIRLVKFDYATIDLSDNITIEDYLNPNRGAVNSYDFNDEENSFGKFVEVDAGTGNYSFTDGEYVKGADNSGNYVWKSVDAMNVYDPFEKIIKGNNFDLSSMYSNAIYEVTFSAPTSDYVLNLTSRIISERTKESDQIFLSKCTDIDVFFEEDLLIDTTSYSNSSTYAVGDLVVYNGAAYQCKTAIGSAEEFTNSHWDAVANYSASSTYAVGKAVIQSDVLYVCRTAVSTPETFDKTKWNKASTYSNAATYAVGDAVVHNGAVYEANTTIGTPESFNSNHWKPVLFNDAYCPSYKPVLTTDDENIYYKMSFLSSKKDNHKHFYTNGGGAEPTSISLNEGDPYRVGQSVNKFKVYINVNYAPSQLESYYSQITSPADVIQAVYDYIFYFTFEEANS